MSPLVLHRAAGLSIAADRYIPGLPAAAAPGRTDVVLHIGAPAPWRHAHTAVVHVSAYTDPSGRPLVVVERAAPDGYRFRYADGTDVWIDAAGKAVWCVWPSTSTLEDAATYLAGPVLGFLLRLRGALAFHASAVQVDGQALILVGPHGAGKSTTAAALARRGCPVITDDVLHVRREGAVWVAEPFADLLRLWPDGAALALGAETSLPLLTPNWGKLALHLRSRGLPTAPRPVPVGAVACLATRDPVAGAPRLESIGASEALVLLAANSSASHLLDRDGRCREFNALSELMPSLRCARARGSGNRALFDRFVDLLQDWAARAPSGRT